jgi:hypothetical protein
MPYKYDPETRAITISAGDTMDFSVNVSGKDYDAAVFAAYNPTTGEDVVVVPAELKSGKCSIRLATRHTRDVPAGKYKWNIRLVSNPGKDEEGNIVADDDSDNVLSVFGPDNSAIPDFVVRRTGAYV